MARTLIRNISGDDLTLPLPYTGVLGGGEATVVADTPEQVIAFFGGWENIRNIWSVDAVSDGNPLGPYQRVTAALNISQALEKLNVPLSVNGQKINNLGTPVAGSDAATKNYVDTHGGGGGGVTALSGSVLPPDGAGPFTPGTPVGISTATGALVACNALLPATFPCIGIWSVDDFIRISGVEAISGYTAGALLYVAEGGGLSETRPTTAGAVAQLVGSGLVGGTSIFVTPGGLQVII
jgi:hypothetical protein